MKAFYRREQLERERERERKRAKMAGFVVAIVLLMVVGNNNICGIESGGGEVHVVGGDQGWDAASNVAAWAFARSFRVGDNIWFTYSAAQESIAELGSKEEYESCDATNPIQMYTSGLDKIELDRQGPRYFVSASPEVCSKGLKLHVHVDPQAEPAGKQALNQVQDAAAMVGAAGPKPSSSVKAGPASAALLWTGLGFLCFMASF